MLDRGTIAENGSCIYDGVLKTITRVVEVLNLQLPKRQRLDPSPGTRLFGASGNLNSLALSNFIVLLENELQDEYGVSIDLTQNDPFSPENGHFATIDSLARHVAELRQQQSSE